MKYSKTLLTNSIFFRNACLGFEIFDFKFYITLPGEKNGKIHVDIIKNSNILKSKNFRIKWDSWISLS